MDRVCGTPIYRHRIGLGSFFDCALSILELRIYSRGPRLIEQDHRGIKFRIGPMLGFKSYESAAITIAGIGLLRRIHKGQFALSRLRLKGQDAPTIWNAVLAA